MSSCFKLVADSVSFDKVVLILGRKVPPLPLIFTYLLIQFSRTEYAIVERGQQNSTMAKPQLAYQCNKAPRLDNFIRKFKLS